MKQELPEWTVEKCICFVGHFRTDCPYALQEELTRFFAEKEEEPLDMLK